MQFGDDEEVGDSAPVPAAVAGSMLRRIPAQVNPPVPVFHPLAYRGVVADWPVEWRERWGRRANDLEEKGLSWRDAEAKAFIETWSELRQGTAEHSANDEGPAGADRN
jgi:hypothetical protein